MAPSSKWAWAKPTLNPIPIIPTMWLALTLLPKIDPATPHQGVLRPARKKSSEVSSLRLAHSPMASTAARDPKKTIRSGVVRTFSDKGGHRAGVGSAGRGPRTVPSRPMGIEAAAGVSPGTRVVQSPALAPEGRVPAGLRTLSPGW